MFSLFYEMNYSALIMPCVAKEWYNTNTESLHVLLKPNLL